MLGVGGVVWGLDIDGEHVDAVVDGSETEDISLLKELMNRIKGE